MRTRLAACIAGAVLLLAACSSPASKHTASRHHAPAASVAAAPSPSQTPSPTPSPTPSRRRGLPLACRKLVVAWLDSTGKPLLRALHEDLVRYNKDDGAVVHDLLYGGNIASAAAKWISDLSVFRQDAYNLQASPAPACAGGVYLGYAAADWAAAAGSYQTAAQIVGSNPTLGGINQGDPYMSAGNRALSHADAWLRKAARRSHRLIWNIAKGAVTG